MSFMYRMKQKFSVVHYVVEIESLRRCDIITRKEKFIIYDVLQNKKVWFDVICCGKNLFRCDAHPFIVTHIEFFPLSR
jgi:hypothetical protein